MADENKTEMEKLREEVAALRNENARQKLELSRRASPQGAIRPPLTSHINNGIPAAPSIQQH